MAEVCNATPGLFYAAMQSHQFYDLRSTTLEDQAHQVIFNKDEFNFSDTAIVNKLTKDSAYGEAFSKAFPKSDKLSGYEVRNAIGAYVRSLMPFRSRWDQYMQGNKEALTAEEKHGFTLFAGKAKCATCHFIPLFNGNIPPWYTKSESEIIGVPQQAVWTKAIIDPDSGRYRINPISELAFAFKTPTVRNIEKTGPYMHNGVYTSLNDVVEFYHRGGGVGLGIDLPFQTLPFDSLILSKTDKKAIVAFMRSLTDETQAK
jgi:cytochrome c peroxidase